MIQLNSRDILVTYCFTNSYTACVGNRSHMFRCVFTALASLERERGPFGLVVEVRLCERHHVHELHVPAPRCVQLHAHRAAGPGAYGAWGDRAARPLTTPEHDLIGHRLAVYQASHSQLPAD